MLSHSKVATLGSQINELIDAGLPIVQKSVRSEAVSKVSPYRYAYVPALSCPCSDPKHPARASEITKQAPMGKSLSLSANPMLIIFSSCHCETFSISMPTDNLWPPNWSPNALPANSECIVSATACVCTTLICAPTQVNSPARRGGMFWLQLARSERS